SSASSRFCVMCCAIRKTLRSYRFTSSSKALMSPALAACTSEISSAGSSTFGWMVPMFVRFRILAPGTKSRSHCTYRNSDSGKPGMKIYVVGQQVAARFTIGTGGYTYCTDVPQQWMSENRTDFVNELAQNSGRNRAKLDTVSLLSRFPLLFISFLALLLGSVAVAQDSTSTHKKKPASSTTTKKP